MVGEGSTEFGGEVGAQFFAQILARKLISCKMNIPACGLDVSRVFTSNGERAISLEPLIEGLVLKISKNGVKNRSAHKYPAKKQSRNHKDQKEQI